MFTVSLRTTVSIFHLGFKHNVHLKIQTHTHGDMSDPDPDYTWSVFFKTLCIRTGPEPMEPFNMTARIPTSLGSGVRYSGWRGPGKQPCSWHYLLSLSGLRVSPVSWRALPSFATGDEVIVAQEKPRQNIRGRRSNHTDGVKDVWLCTAVSPGTHSVYGKRSLRVRNDGVPLPPCRGGLWPPRGRLIAAVTVLDGNASGWLPI